MRLLHVNDDNCLSLVEFFEGDIPPYAILSHTWGPDSEEVSYRDMVDKTGIEKRGYGKIRECARQAKEDGLHHFWVDTCCRGSLLPVDKSSSAELTESINSMFQWYKQAVVCYALLEDLVPGPAQMAGFSQCRWFTRGWTLQELLAPDRVNFYNKTWEFVGDKRDHARLISKFTNIPTPVLLGLRSLSRLSIASRMSWASTRKTKRKEDMAYCLLGIFDVNMPLIYGEGSKAFQRLQEEIIKRNNDLTIFAWDAVPYRLESSESYVGIFAESPAAFAGRSNMQTNTAQTEFSLTNRGLLLTGLFNLYSVSAHAGNAIFSKCYVLLIGSTGRSPTGIVLRKCGMARYCRFNNVPFAEFSNFSDAGSRSGAYSMAPYGGYSVKTDLVESRVYISLAIDDQAPSALLSSYRKNAVHIPKQERLKMVSAVPMCSWDHVDSVFLPERPNTGIRYHTVLAAEFIMSKSEYSVEFSDEFGPEYSKTKYKESIIVVYSNDNDQPRLQAFLSKDYYWEMCLLFRGKAREEGISWVDLMRQAPRLLPLDNSTVVKLGEDTFNVNFSLQDGNLIMSEMAMISSGRVAVQSIISSISPVEPRPDGTQSEVSLDTK